MLRWVATKGDGVHACTNCYPHHLKKPRKTLQGCGTFGCKTYSSPFSRALCKASFTGSRHQPVWPSKPGWHTMPMLMPMYATGHYRIH